ncbi:uncharacterized protein LOC115722279 isoform X3 [Cannabis sativa]|uniref:uncharacterized protein LOC115722279 isoform X3 n=1 Tax=Cannabis sativa TaxID=3483 RepID=UPI0029CA61C4|nr:uncharacterized protein LOC115722279 isoform X3 [Cannabis sativa]
MATQLCSFGEILSVKSDGNINGVLPSDELDHVPLIHRRSLLLANKSPNCNTEPSAVESGTGKLLMSRILIKEEDESCDSLDVLPTSALPPKQVVHEYFAQHQNHAVKDCEQVHCKVSCNRVVENSVLVPTLEIENSIQEVGTSRDCLIENSEQIKCTVSNGDVPQVKVESHISSFPAISTLSEVPAVAHSGSSCNLLHSMGGCIQNSSSADVPTIKVRRKLAANVSCYPAISTLSDVPAVAAHMGNSDNMLHSMGGCLRNSSVADLPPVQVKSEISDLIDDDCLDHIVLKERQRMLLSRKLLRMTKPALEISLEASSGNGIQQCDEKQKEQTPDVIGVSLTAKNYDKTYSSTEFISCERQDNMLVYTNDISSSSLSTSLKIKDEPHDDNNCQNLEGNACDTFSFNMPGVKAEVEISNEDDEDERDHICLGDRTKLLKLKDDYEIKSVPFATEGSPIAADSAKPFSINRIRKRKKTATDSAETALEEDAPGLLQVLIEKGISTDEIKLYGQMESDEALDESSSESFSELESVIMKIFTQRHSFFKLAPIRYTKGSRTSYCLACLLSLVEQTRYLQFRKWPVEWGWCRDLQSFIFVFKGHNRIVLERPEYGYATYFFELVDSLSIDWQIKRLVTAMKLTTCSRISLIENKALVVGKDLTQGEAKVLIEYGWIPNSGFGTMLNYRDRVVHDRKNEKDTSEWRSKIGKLLMDGYNGGILVATSIPEEVESKDSQSPEVKLEPF